MHVGPYLRGSKFSSFRVVLLHLHGGSIKGIGWTIIDIGAKVKNIVVDVSVNDI